MRLRACSLAPKYIPSNWIVSLSVYAWSLLARLTGGFFFASGRGRRHTYERWHFDDHFASRVHWFMLYRRLFDRVRV